jgi:glycogen debranching enzyme
VDEIVEYDGLALPLFANRWAGNTIDPHGYRMIERFTLEGATSVWTYAVADALVEKRVWMEQGANTTYVQYRVLRARGRLALKLKVFVNYRNYHESTRGNDWQMDVALVKHGLRVAAFERATPLLLLADGAEMQLAHT